MNEARIGRIGNAYEPNKKPYVLNVDVHASLLRMN